MKDEIEIAKRKQQALDILENPVFIDWVAKEEGAAVSTFLQTQSDDMSGMNTSKTRIQVVRKLAASIRASAKPAKPSTVAMP